MENIKKVSPDNSGSSNSNIKFKAFIKKREVIVDVLEIDFENKTITWWDGQYDRSYPEPNVVYERDSFDDIILIQYTGFKDKKDKEIYEGDIMNCYEKGFDYPQILVVGFCKGQYMLYNPNCCSCCKNQDGCVCSLGESLYYEYEIIGNIHQNYDLLPIKSEK